MYTESFKKEALGRYEEGWTAQAIFQEAGFDLNQIGRGQPTECLKHWRRRAKRNGDTDGKRGRPKKRKDRSPEEKIKRLEAEVGYLKTENDFLARRWARQNGGVKPRDKYRLIATCGIEVKTGCDIARVSKNGYYQWKFKQLLPKKDEEDYQAIRATFERG
jgi:hypothetical protein